MTYQRAFNPSEVNYLDLPDNQKARVLSQAIAQGRLERSLAVYRAFRKLGRFFLNSQPYFRALIESDAEQKWRPLHF